MGAMVTRYMIADASGLVLTLDEFWSYELDDAIKFRHEDEAEEACALYPGSTVERVEFWAPVPDFKTPTARRIAA